jgi:hypothetical protein
MGAEAERFRQCADVGVPDQAYARFPQERYPLPDHLSVGDSATRNRSQKNGDAHRNEGRAELSVSSLASYGEPESPEDLASHGG